MRLGSCRWNCCERLGFYEVVADGEAHEFGEAAEFHFMHDVVAVAFDGANGKADGWGDLFIAHAAGEHLQDLNFAGGERRAGERVVFGGFAFLGILNEIVDHGEGEFAGKEGTAALDLTDGLEQIDVSVGFEDVAIGAGAESFAGDILGEMHGEDEDVGFGGDGANFADGVEAVHLRHGEVEQDHFGFVFFDVLESFEAVGSLVANFDTGLEFKKAANSAADDGVIVGDEDAVGF